MLFRSDQGNPALHIFLRHQCVRSPWLDRFHFDITLRAQHRLNRINGINIPPVLALIEYQVVGVGAVRVPGQQETAMRAMKRKEDIAVSEVVVLDEIGRTKIERDERCQPGVALIIDTELFAHSRPTAITSGQIIGRDFMHCAVREILNAAAHAFTIVVKIVDVWYAIVVKIGVSIVTDAIAITISTLRRI